MSPWGPNDAVRHTKRASSPHAQEVWAHVANSVLQDSGDEGRAVREANAAVASLYRGRKGKGKGANSR